MSADSQLRENIERLKQTISDAKRLRKQLKLQIKEVDAKLEKFKAAKGERKRRTHLFLI